MPEYLPGLSPVTGQANPGSNSDATEVGAVLMRTARGVVSDLRSITAARRAECLREASVRATESRVVDLKPTARGGGD